MERIIQNQPWSFEKHLVVLYKFDEFSKLEDLVFDKTLFWVQVNDIPIHFMSKRVAKSICEIMGLMMMMEVILYRFMSQLIFLFPYVEEG